MSARILSMGYHHSAAIGYREPSDSCFLADLMYIGSSFRRFSAVERLCARPAQSDWPVFGNSRVGAWVTGAATKWGWNRWVLLRIRPPRHRHAAWDSLVRDLITFTSGLYFLP
jgi:hypothetical protein